VTIKDIARQAGVSVATVSRVLNNQTGFSEATKDRVLRVIENSGYTRNDLARSLSGKRTQSIGLLLPSLTSYFVSELLSGVETRAHAADLSVIICDTDQDGARTLKYLRMLREKRVDGVIFVSEWLTDEYKKAFDLLQTRVVLVSTYSPLYSFPYIKIDDYRASYDAVAYLIQRGHRQIAMIGGSEDDPIAGKPRLDGYRAALKHHNLPIREEYVAHGDFDFRSGMRAMDTLWDRAPQLTAVFAASDEMAVGALNSAHRHGKRVPDDLSIVGFDDTQLAEMVPPGLTAVRQPVRELGRRAVEYLIGSSEDVAGIILPHSITERASVRTLT